MFNPQYILNNKILKNLTDIAEAKAVIERARLLPAQELHLKRQAIVRMSHSSTAIEGNILNIRQVEALEAGKKIEAPARDIYEVKNYLAVLKYINKVVEEKKEIDEKVLLKIHAIVTNKTLPDIKSGRYRQEPVYIAQRQLGLPDRIIYTAPKAGLVPTLCADLMQWIKKSEAGEINPVIIAGEAHLELAAIHPFVDGNGRTARALATLILYKCGYDFRHLFALEDYYNKDLLSYYRSIDTGENYEKRKTDSTIWLEYFVAGFREEIMNVKVQVTSLAVRKIGKSVEKQIYLTPRQQQILDFIDQLRKVTTKDVMDILRCPKRTAQLELQKLKKIGIIKSAAKGKATYYKLK